ncbi:MAG: hypothetical protein ACRC80_15035 [Waterburya sp.]
MCLLANERETKVAMRSYENHRPHQAFSITETGDTIQTEFYNYLSPSKFFFQQLDHPTDICRGKTFKKTGILKLNDWKNNFSKWLDKGFVSGDTIEKVGILREFSISQFTYQTIDQYLAIEKEVQRNKRLYNQSYEGYFINDDDSLNYQLMIETIDEIISRGALSINHHRPPYIQHPQSPVYEAVKQQANLGVDVDPLVDDDRDLEATVPVIFDGELPDLDW